MFLKMYRVAFWRLTPHWNDEAKKLEQRWELWVHQTRYWSFRAAQMWAERSATWDSIVHREPQPPYVVVTDDDVQYARSRDITVKLLGMKVGV